MSFQGFIKSLENTQYPLDFPGHFVGGSWLTFSAEKALKASTNPSTGAALVQPTTSREALYKALESAERAQPILLKSNLEQRVELIRQMRQALADYQSVAVHIMRTESGKPRWEAETDFEFAIKYLDAFCTQAKEIVEAAIAPARYDRIAGDFKLTPIGTTIAFLPFSTPITSFSKYFAATVLTGCPFILCPSSHATLSGLLFAAISESLEIPEGGFNVIFGNFESFKKALSDRRIQAIIYTGSREHCELIRRESRAVKSRQLILQSGGKNAALVHSSADMESAMRCVLIGAFKSAGQLCSSTSRVFVHKSRLEEFNEQLVHQLNQLPIGATDTEEDQAPIFLGPLYSRKAVDKFLRYQTMAHREASVNLQWGKTLEGKGQGYFVQPGIHLMREFDPSSSYQANVLFCPDLAIYAYEKLEGAVERINATDAPLAVSLIGEAEDLANRCTDLKIPNILVNMPTVDIETTPSLTGRLHSGQHRFNGPGLVLLLSNPQLSRKLADKESILKAWTW